MKCKEWGIEKGCTKDLYWFDLHNLESTSSPHSLVGFFHYKYSLEQASPNFYTTFIQPWAISFSPTKLHLLMVFSLLIYLTRFSFLLSFTHVLELQHFQNMRWQDESINKRSIKLPQEFTKNLSHTAYVTKTLN